MALNIKVWHLSDIADYDAWLVDDIPLNLILNPTKLGEVIAEEFVTILSESKTTSPNVIIFMSQHTNIKHVAIWGDSVNKFVNFFINTTGDFSDRLLYVSKKLNIQLKAGVENDDLEFVTNKLFDMIYKGLPEDYDGERQRLVAKFKSITGKEKPGFM